MRARCSSIHGRYSDTTTQKKVSSEAVPLTKEQRSLPNDATQLASNDSKRAQIIPIPFSVETTGAQVLDTKSPTDFLDFFAHLRVKSNEALDVDEIFLEEESSRP